jgi:transcriptional regulator with XRE-family HTH domain/quercetin dioxygenase-like cupin family protein
VARPRLQPSATDAGATPERGPESVGTRLRTERERQRIGLRELARRVNVSASLISQVELGKATPSVGTLYAIVNELGMSLDELFFDSGGPALPGPQGTVPFRASDQRAAGDGRRPRIVDASHPGDAGIEPVVRRGDRKSIQLDSGVRWERLTPVTEQDLDFLYVVYDVGGASCAANSLIRHSGKEYGHVIKGRLGVTVGFDTHELGPGDSISFDSTVPHRLFNAGDEPVEGIWFVVGRGGDARVTNHDDLE